MKTIIATLFVLTSTLSFAQIKMNNLFCVYRINKEHSESDVTRKRTATISDLLSDTELRVCSDLGASQSNVEIASFTLSIYNKSSKTLHEFKETIGSKLTDEQLSSIRELAVEDEIFIENIKVNTEGAIGEKCYYIRIAVI